MGSHIVCLILLSGPSENFTKAIVLQLSKCLKFEAIRGDQTDQKICI